MAASGTAPGLAVVDTGTAGTDQATLQVTMDQFAPFDVSPASATPILRVSFDLRVDSYLAAANTNIPRFILRANNVNNTGSQIVIAFGRAFLNDADATEDLVVYADTATGNTSNVPPKDISAIGLIPGIGWQPGFDLGTYDAADGTLNDTNDEFYRIALDYNSISGTITGSATQLSTGAVATFPTGLTLTPGTSFSNASGTSVDRFLLASSVGNTAMAYFDNFVFQAVPEPTTSMLLLAAMGVVCVRRRKNSSIASTR